MSDTTQDQVLVGDGDNYKWIECPEDFDPREHQCGFCTQQATRLAVCGRNEGGTAYWAVCDDCMAESEAQSRDGEHRSQYEMDYYAGYE